MLLNIHKVLDNTVDTSDLHSQKVESSMSSSINTSFVTKSSTHFCYKCGWIDDIDVTMERKEYTNPTTGKTEVSHYFIKTDKNLECPECNKRSAIPLTMGNTVHAVEYLLRALR